MTTPTRAEELIEIDAAPERVYDLVSDLTRMGEWSPECYRVDWVGDRSGPVVGAEFKGYNRIGPYRWSVEAKVVTADRGREFAFTTHVKGRELTRWRYRLDASGDGTLVTEGYEVIWAPLPVRLGARLPPRRRSMQRGMRQTLQRIKAAAEGPNASGTGRD